MTYKHDCGQLHAGVLYPNLRDNWNLLIV